MQDFYWSDRRSGSAGYHHCYSVKISSKDNKAEPESAFTYVHTARRGESESCWQHYDYLTQFAEIEFSLSLPLKSGGFFSSFLRPVAQNESSSLQQVLIFVPNTARRELTASK